MAKARVCSEENCGKPHYAFGACKAHYLQLYVPPCSVPDCIKPRHANGYCGMHAERFRKTGSVNGFKGLGRAGEPSRYFREVVVRHKGESCLVWPHSRDANGYAVMSRNGKRWLVYRAACIIVHGRPPTDRHEAAHNCGNGAGGCVNPQHIRWATHRDNLADMVAHGTHTRGEKHQNSKLTEADVLKIRAAIGVPHRQLAEKFGVCRATISEIRSRRKWSWLD